MRPSGDVGNDGTHTGATRTIEVVTVVDPDDPREQIQVAVLLANGRLAGRRFADRAEAAAWAQPGEEVVELNLVCECDR